MHAVSAESTTPPLPRQRRRVGLPLAERRARPSDEVEVPSPPIECDRALRDEEQVLRLEQLMLQGVTHSRELMPLLEITDRRQLERYRGRVEVRWKRDCSWPDIETQRGKALMEYELLWKLAFQEYNDATSERAKKEALNLLLTIRIKMDSFQGFTPRMAENHANQSTPKVPDSVLRDMAKQEELVEMMKVFAGFIEEEQEVEDAESQNFVN